MTILPQQQPDALSHPQPQRRRRPARALLLIGGLIVLVVAGGIAWWLFSPLFLHTTGNDANPFANAPSAASTSGIVSTPVPPGPVTLPTGKFIDKVNSAVGLANDHGSGNPTIRSTPPHTYPIPFLP